MSAGDWLRRWVSAPAEPLHTVEVEGYATMGRAQLWTQGVHTLEDVMQLRALRNECREWMTGHTAMISEAEQLSWWQNVAGNPEWLIKLVYAPDFLPAIGYMVLRRGINEDTGAPCWYVSLGITAMFRGRGHGTRIYRMARMVDHPGGPLVVYALIRPDNIASIKAAEKAGYVRICTTSGGLVKMAGRIHP